MNKKDRFGVNQILAIAFHASWPCVVFEVRQIRRQDAPRFADLNSNETEADKELQQESNQSFPSCAHQMESLTQCRREEPIRKSNSYCVEELFGKRNNTTERNGGIVAVAQYSCGGFHSESALDQILSRTHVMTVDSPSISISSGYHSDDVIEEGSMAYNAESEDASSYLLSWPREAGSASRSSATSASCLTSTQSNKTMPQNAVPLPTATTSNDSTNECSDCSKQSDLKGFHKSRNDSVAISLQYSNSEQGLVQHSKQYGKPRSPLRFLPKATSQRRAKSMDLSDSLRSNCRDDVALTRISEFNNEACNSAVSRSCLCCHVNSGSCKENICLASPSALPQKSSALPLLIENISSGTAVDVETSVGGFLGQENVDSVYPCRINVAQNKSGSICIPTINVTECFGAALDLKAEADANICPHNGKNDFGTTSSFGIFDSSDASFMNTESADSPVRQQRQSSLENTTESHDRLSSTTYGSQNKRRSRSIDVSCLVANTLTMFSNHSCLLGNDAKAVIAIRSRSIDFSLDDCGSSKYANSLHSWSTLIKKAVSRSPRTSLAGQEAALVQDKCSYWSEAAKPDDHIWCDASASGDCYVNEAVCVKTGERKKCAACRVSVHDGCMQHLLALNVRCKPTFNEAVFDKSLRHAGKAEPHSRHHWVYRRRQDGKCGACGRSFQQKLFSRDFIAVVCSWCRLGYHNKPECLADTDLTAQCLLGSLSSSVVPSSWIFKLPPRRTSTIKKYSSELGSYGMSRRRKRSKKERFFIVKPPAECETGDPVVYPLLVFVNPLSGGNKGLKLWNAFCWLLNPRQVFDVTALNGPRYGLEMYRKVANLRILVCGGDGTVGWILSVLDVLKWPTYPPIAILPLGTGNDLSNSLGWGKTLSDESLESLLRAITSEASVVQLDRWHISVTPNERCEQPDGSEDVNAAAKLPLAVMNNYFSIGADASVALKFHECRAANPESFTSRFRNRVFYGTMGTKDLFQRAWKDLADFVTLECDGVDLTERIQELKPHCIVVLNIPRYAGGTLPWGSNASLGSPSNSGFSAPSFSDGKLEVLGFTASTLAALQVEAMLQVERMQPLAQRIAQCGSLRLTTTKAIPAQVDGEPTLLAPSTLTIRLHCRVPMLQRCTAKRLSYAIPQLPLLGFEMQASPSNMSTGVRFTIRAVSREDYDSSRHSYASLKQCSLRMGEVTLEPDCYLDYARLIIDAKVIACAILPEGNKKVEDSHCSSDDIMQQQWSFLDCSCIDRMHIVHQNREAVQCLSDIIRCEDATLLFILDPKISNFAPISFIPAIESASFTHYDDIPDADEEYIQVMINDSGSSSNAYELSEVML